MAYASLGYGGQRLVLACADYPRLRDRHTGKFLEEYRQFGTVKTSQTHGLGFHFSNEEFGVIAFRNLQEPDRFRGTECAALAVDEATELPEVIGGLGVLETLKYPIRSSMGLPFAPLLMGSNPDGVGHKWVKGLFITRTGIPKGDDESRYVYVPALPNDNPYLSQAWIDELATYPEHIRRARLDGSWDAPEGARWGYLNKHDHAYRFDEKFPNGVPLDGFSILGLDWGLAAPYAAVWFYVSPDLRDFYAYREDYAKGLTYDQQAERIVRMTSVNERVQHVRADPAMWQQPKDPVTGEIKPAAITYFDDMLGREGRFPRCQKGFNQSRRIGHMTLDSLLRRDNFAPNLWIDPVRCPNLWSELESAVFDTRSAIRTSEELDPRCADHAITASIYALHNQIYDFEPQQPETYLPSAEEMDAINARLLNGEYDDSRAQGAPRYLRGFQRF